MEDKTQHGYLVLADISGYTSYLAGTELDHAHEILTDLLEIIVRRLKTLLTIVKLEGDAVLAYSPASSIPRGETLLELIETTYAAFRNRQETIRRQTTCQCNACRSLPMLDLKFLAHHGDYMVQHVAGINELVGSDVNLIHRLLKNNIGKTTGWRAYALFTQAGLTHMGVLPDGMHAQPERYEHLGEVQTFSLDLRQRYAALTQARRAFLAPEDADVSLEADLGAAPAVVWSWLNDPARRTQWMPGTSWTAASRPGGRTDVGSSNHCAHGQGETSVENILDWRPFEYYTAEQIPNPGKPMRMILTYVLTPVADGQQTHLEVRVQLRNPPLPRWVTRPMCRAMYKQFGIEESMQLLRQLVTGQTAAPTPAAVPA